MAEKETRGRGGGRFATTHWSVVLAARDRASPRSREALETLCQTYWYPLYAFVRRRGTSPEESQDLTQEFFARLLEKESLRHVDPSRGRFRSFLLTAFKNFMADEGRRARAQKRGGGQIPVSIDLRTAEGRYVKEPEDQRTPEKIYERRWALILLGRTVDRLGEEYARAGRERLFERIKGYLTGQAISVPYARVAQELDMNEVTVKVAVHRLRRRYRALLLAEIGQTVGTEEEIEAEVQHLIACVER